VLFVFTLDANGCWLWPLGNSKIVGMDKESKADERKEERKATQPQWTRASCYRALRRNLLLLQLKYFDCMN